ncbi:anti-sigma factor [Paracoccus pacificus]|uniref:Regulator of SigK n=1 Tax=Paracoccus pacificus TaxID=1463598 RepID=A0ABW4R9M5_9RHOB
MSDIVLPPDEEDEALAAEYALGLLPAEEMLTVRDRLGRDTAFAAKVRLWQERLAAMVDEVPPEPVPKEAWAGIQQALGQRDQPMGRPRAPARASGGWFAGWKAWLSGAIAICAVAVAIMIYPFDTAPKYAADLVSETTGLRVEARLDGRAMKVTLTAGGPPEGRDLELWWIAGEGKAPVSLGLVPRDGTASVNLPPELVPGVAPAAAVQLAVSDEPLGGSPTGAPTGEVMAIAPLTTL